MITPRASIDIDADAESVIRFIADPAIAPLWMVALEQSVQITPGPIAPGSRFREVQNAGGQRVETICEVVAFDPARQYAWKSVGQSETTYGGSFTAERDGGGTRLRYEGW